MLNKISFIQSSSLTKKSQQQNQIEAKHYHRLMLRLHLDSSIQIKNYHHYHLTSRLNQEYHSSTENVAPQGASKELHSVASLSLPVCSFLLSQKLLQVKEIQNEAKSCNQMTMYHQLNNY
ncbi:MAG TPA: hypothetical protein ACHBX0_15055 [Arsenophonus sp.]